MAIQYTPVSPFALFQPNGPLGYWPNNFAANAGDLPNILWVSSLQTPILNAFSPVFSALVTNVLGGGPAPLGSPMRPAPLGAVPTATGTTGTTLLTPATSLQGGTAGTALTPGLVGSTAPLTLTGTNSLTGANPAALSGLTGTNFAGTNFIGAQVPVATLTSLPMQNGIGSLGGLGNINGFGTYGAGNIPIPGMMSVGGQAFNGNGAFLSQLGIA